MHGATFFGPDERWRDYLPVEEKISDEQQLAAGIYDLYDGGCPWDGENNFDNPAKYGYTRPVNSKGQLVDSNGFIYELDTASGKRKYIKE
jgi:hypothetical protein